MKLILKKKNAISFHRTIAKFLFTGQPLCLQFYFATAASESSNLQLRRQFANGTMGDLWAVQFSDLKLPAGSTVSPWLPAQVHNSFLLLYYQQHKTEKVFF